MSEVCSVPESKKKGKFKIMIAGAAAGLINGLFGSGGGMIVVPALKEAGVETHRSHATALVVIFPLSLISAGVYWFKTQGLPPQTWIICLAGIAGALTGACLLTRLKGIVLEVGLSVVMIISAVRMLCS